MVDFPLLLSQLVSPNSHVAYNQIEELKKQNLSLFLIEMAKQMLNNSIPPNQKQMAALIIKNSVIGSSKTVTDELNAKWMSISTDQRNSIKSLLIQGLSLEIAECRASAAQVVGQIAVVEICNGEWKDIIPILITNIQKGSLVLKEGSLHALGILCEEMPPNIIDKQSNDILLAITSGFNKDYPVEIHRSSIKALYGTLSFVEHHFKQQNQRDFLMNNILTATISSDKLVRYKAVQCLVRTGEFYYNYLAAYFEAIWKCTLNIIKNDEEHIAQQGIEFWSSICDVEIDIYQNIEEGDNNEIIHHIIRNIAQYLIPVLFECLTKQNENIYDDDWNTAKSASACLTLIARTIKDLIVPHTISSIGNAISHENWRFKEASTLALGCIVEGASNNSKLPEFLDNVIPVLVKHLKEDSCLLVRDTTAWTISKIAMFHPNVVEKHLNSVIEALISGINSTELIIAVQSCSALVNVIAIYNYEEEDTSPLSKGFNILFKALLDASDRSDACDSNLCITAYEGINILISQSAFDCQDNIISLINPFIEKLKNTFNNSVDAEIQNQLQSYIPSVLQTIISKIEDLISPFANNILLVLFQLFEFRKSVLDEPMMCINELLSLCESLVNSNIFHQLKPILLCGYKNPDDINSFVACLHCLSILCDYKELGLFTHDNGKFCDELFNCFLTILQNQNAPFVTKQEIFSTFGDIAESIGNNFERYFPSVMLYMEGATSILIDPNSDDTIIDNIIELRETILGTYSMLLHSNFGNQLVQHYNTLYNFIKLLWEDTEFRTKSLVKLIILFIKDLSIYKESKEFINQPLIKQIINYGKHKSTSSKVRQIASSINI